MGGITGGTVPALIWKDVMTVATAPYGNADFEYPEVILILSKLRGYQSFLRDEAEKEIRKQRKRTARGRERKS